MGPPLVLIHGIGDRADTWSELVPILAQRHSVLAPALRGRGRADEPYADDSVAHFANATCDLLCGGRTELTAGQVAAARPTA